jgi:hypothetical protein
MDGMRFWGLCANVDRLSVGQPRELRRKLRALDVRREVLARIDVRGQALERCVHCVGSALGPLGLDAHGPAAAALQGVRADRPPITCPPTSHGSSQDSKTNKPPKTMLGSGCSRHGQHGRQTPPEYIQYTNMRYTK